MDIKNMNFFLVLRERDVKRNIWHFKCEIEMLSAFDEY